MSQEQSQLQTVVAFKDGTAARFNESIPVVMQKCAQLGKEVKYAFLSPPIKGYTDIQIARMEAAERKRKRKPKTDK